MKGGECNPCCDSEVPVWNHGQDAWRARSCLLGGVDVEVGKSGAGNRVERGKYRAVVWGEAEVVRLSSCGYMSERVPDRRDEEEVE